MAASNPNLLQHLTRAQRLKVVGTALLRTLISLAVILWMYSLVPEGLEGTVLIPYGVLLIMVVVYVWQFRSQLGRIQRASYPGIQATEALIISAAFFLTIFAGFYVMIHGENAQAFSAPITHVSALYFTVTVFATVGFGDIVATTDLARVVVTAQMLLGLAFLAVLVKVFTGAAQTALQRRRSAAEPT
jgi:hypothetical protein